MHKCKSLKVIASMSALERFEKAGELTDRLLTAVITHIRTHENNRLIVFSDTLTSQVENTYAGHAFQRLVYDLIHLELVRVTALWDDVDLDSFSLPTIAALAGCDCVKELSVKKHIQQYPDDPEHAKEWGETARNRLENALAVVAETRNGPMLESVRNHRHKLAHSLDVTRAEKLKSIDRPKLGDERQFLENAIQAVDLFHLSLNSTGFDFEGMRENARNQSSSLWSNAKLNVKM